MSARCARTGNASPSAAERTFLADLHTAEQADAVLPEIIEKVWRHCETTSLRGRTLTLKVKYADFHQITRSHTDAEPIVTRASFERRAKDLLAPIFPAHAASACSG